MSDYKINKNAPIWKIVKPNYLRNLIFDKIQNQTTDKYLVLLKDEIKGKLDRIRYELYEYIIKIHLNLLNTAKEDGFIHSDVEFQITKDDYGNSRISLNLDGETIDLENIKLPISYIGVENCYIIEIVDHIFLLSRKDHSMFIHNGYLKYEGKMPTNTRLFIAIFDYLFGFNVNLIGNKLNSELLSIIKCDTDIFSDAFNNIIENHKGLLDESGISTSEKSIFSIYARYLESLSHDELLSYHFDHDELMSKNVSMNLIVYSIFDKIFNRLKNSIVSKYIDPIFKECKPSDSKLIYDIIKDGYESMDKNYESIIRSIKYGKEDLNLRIHEDELIYFVKEKLNYKTLIPKDLILFTVACGSINIFNRLDLSRIFKTINIKIFIGLRKGICPNVTPRFALPRSYGKDGKTDFPKKGMDIKDKINEIIEFIVNDYYQLRYFNRKKIDITIIFEDEDVFIEDEEDEEDE